MEFTRLIQKVSSPVLIFTLLFSLALYVPPVYSGISKGKVLRVTVAKAALKDSPKPFGAKIIRRVEVGDEVTYLEESGIYYKVTHNGTSGYLASKSVTEPKSFTAFSRGGKVTDSDVSAATKGFSPDVERERRKDKKLRYDLMDRGEQLSTVADPMTSLADFRRAGKLGEFAEVSK